MTPGTAAFLGGAGALAGAVNAVAGGGFPALLAAGYPPVTANVTNTVALVPGYAGSVAGSRAELAGQRSRAQSLGWATVAGAVLGSLLLLTTSSEIFRAAIPWLVLLDCALLLAQPRLARRVQHGGHSQRTALLQAGVLLAATYGAYFGATGGVVLLGVLGVFLGDKLARVNALKNVLTTVVNLVALVAFGLFGPGGVGGSARRPRPPTSARRPAPASPSHRWPAGTSAGVLPAAYQPRSCAPPWPATASSSP